MKIADVTAYAEFEIQRLDQNVEFDVIDYTFGDSVEAPEVTGAQEDPVIEYYYTTENSNTDGTLWENSRSADPGTYYMYAKVCATTNYNEYVTQPVQFTVAKREAPTDITAADIVKTYDGKAYGITVTGDIPEDAVVTYGTSEDACDKTVSPKYSQASDEPYTVYYKVAARDITRYPDMQLSPSTEDHLLYRESKLHQRLTMDRQRQSLTIQALF